MLKKKKSLCVIWFSFKKKKRVLQFKLQVSFRKRATNYRALLQKEVCKDNSGLFGAEQCRQNP